MTNSSHWREVAIILVCGFSLLCYSIATLDSSLDKAREDTQKVEKNLHDICKSLSYVEKIDLPKPALEVCENNFPLN